jgi:hypothetical protein
MSILFEILLQLLLEIVVGAGLEGVAGLLKKRSGSVSAFVDRIHTRLVPLSIILATGVVVGFVWGSVSPSLLLPPFSRLSLVVAPILAGLLFGSFGRFLGSRGFSPSILFSFWGGAVLALGVTVARYSVTWTPT